MGLGSEGITEMPPQEVETSYRCIESPMERPDAAALARDSFVPSTVCHAMTHVRTCVNFLTSGCVCLHSLVVPIRVKTPAPMRSCSQL
jgi:hypothetical protein